MSKYIPAILGIALIALLAQAQSTPAGAAILDSGIALDLTPKQLLMWLPAIGVAIYFVYRNIERLLPIFVVALLIFVALTASGCAGVAESIADPSGYTARTQAKEKTAQDQAFAESQRWLSEGKHADADKARSDSEARQAEADAQTAQAQANAFAQLGDAIKEAGRPNNAPIIVAMILIVAIAGWAVWNARQVTVDTIAATRPQIQPPPSVLLIAQQTGLTPLHDGQRWLLLDEQGHVVQRQRLLTG